ncbi:MAG: hypothetical protein KAJ04_05550, partial [Candidatus Eisenbacteria sp.]|nr:hypothetical protein [Candidatus Eisenbacteria bacterium]
GDSTWWCGTYNNCWRQPRGYGNDWLCSIVREFPLSEWSEPGDQVALDWDQRFAMENDYDYGYFDVSDDGSAWTTIAVFNNPGFTGTPGLSCNWNCMIPECEGYQRQDLDAYAGLDIVIRYRFESDGAYSSQDQHDEPNDSSVRDGAWQLDNFTLSVNDTVRWYDDCESPGSNGWAHGDIPATGQVGVAFRRTYCPETFRPPSCESVLTGWWMAALDPVSGRMVDGQASWLVSPPIDISGAEHLIGEWTCWQDLPRPTEDVYDFSLTSSDIEECVRDLDEFEDMWLGWWDGPYRMTLTDDWDDFAGKDWMAIEWRLWNTGPAFEPHMTGFMLDRQRVGIPTGELGTTWRYSVWLRFNDWFVEQMAEALADSAIIDVRDDDDIISVTLVATNGSTTTSYPCRRLSPEGNNWNAPPPIAEIVPGAEIRYYFEAADGVGNTSTYPKSAPDAYYEFSILPIVGSVADPAVLLVDKHGRTTPGEDRRYRHTSERYFREALDILGFEYDVFDVNVPSGSILSEGPDSSGMKYYDTQIWFTNEFDSYTIREFDQRNLIAWLGQSEEGKERNLLLTGNEIGRDLIEHGEDMFGFYTEWLGSEYVRNNAGTYEDTMPILRDAAGGFDFMTFDDRECHLWDALCLGPHYFDVVRPDSTAEGAELVAEYVIADMTVWPGGVAYTHPVMGYQTVNLGF